MYSLKSVFNVFLGETRCLVPELSRRPPAAINSRIYIIVSGKKLYICKRASKTQGVWSMETSKLGRKSNFHKQSKLSKMKEP